MNENHLLMQSIKDYAIFMLTPEGIIASWNEGAMHIKGYKGNEIIGKHFSIFYTEEDLKINKPANELKIALATGKYEEEGWRKKKDGSLFWANVIISSVYDERGRHVGFSKVTRDLTERKRIEEALRRSEERHRLLIEQVKDYGIFMLDENGYITSWNEGAARINGYTTGEIIGKHFSIFYPEEDKIANKPQNELIIARKTGKYEEEGWRLRKNGERFWANVVITAIFSEKDKLYGFAKVTRDLTERQRAEANVRESFEKYKLLAEELKQTNIKLMAVNEQLEQFASIASHDLKEPLRKIITFADLIQNDKQNTLSETSQKNFSKIIAGSRRMSRMIEDVLSFSSLAQKQEFETVSLQLVLDEITELLEPSIKEKNATIESPHLPELKAIPSQMRQLFQNIISNSLKFSRKDVPPKITISYEIIPGAKIKAEGIDVKRNYLQLIFKDNGIGFQIKDEQKIFDLFSRLHVSNEYTGTGIGLAIVKKIVENHDGFIFAQGGTENGAVFKILLPV